MNSKSLEWQPRDLITEDEGRFKHIWKAKNMEKAHAFQSILKVGRIKSQQDRGPLKTKANMVTYESSKFYFSGLEKTGITLIYLIPKTRKLSYDI